jgi:tetratricopeptide (TPR) repeat protein
LGVILYELLAGRSPYPTDGPISQVVRNISEVVPAKPSECDRRLGDELDTIVLKALAKDPARRYPSVDALAADIERYLAGRPIEAKSDSGWYVLKKSLIRYRAAVAVATAFVITISGALVVSLWQWRAAQRNAVAAEVNARAAQASFGRARDTVEQMLTVVTEDSMTNIPQTEVLRSSLVEKALRFYQGSLEENSDDPAVRFETGCAYCRLGRCAIELGQFEQGLGFYRQAIVLLERLSLEHPATPEYRVALADSWGHLGTHLRLNLHRLQEGEAAHRKALELHEKLAADSPRTPAYLAKLASGHVNLGHVFRETYRFQEAEREFRVALAIREALATQLPADPVPLADSHQWLGELLMATNRMPEAETHLRAVVLVHEQLLASSPANTGRRAALARRQMSLGELLFRTRRFAEAEELFRQAIAHEEQLRTDFPGVRQYLHHLSLAHERLGQGLLLAGEFDRAEQVLRQVLHLCEEQVARFPESAEEGTLLAWAHYNLGVALYQAGRRDEATEEFRAAVPLLEKRIVLHPDSVRFAGHLAWVLTTCPDARFHDGDRAVAIAQKGLRLSPDLPLLHQAVGMGHYRAGRWEQAIPALEKGTPEAETWLFLAMTHARLGHAGEARAFYDRAVKWMEEKASGDETQCRVREEAAAVLGLASRPS